MTLEFYPTTSIPLRLLGQVKGRDRHCRPRLITLFGQLHQLKGSIPRMLLGGSRSQRVVLNLFQRHLIEQISNLGQFLKLPNRHFIKTKVIHEQCVEEFEPFLNDTQERLPLLLPRGVFFNPLCLLLRSTLNQTSILGNLKIDDTLNSTRSLFALLAGFTFERTMGKQSIKVDEQGLDLTIIKLFKASPQNLQKGPVQWIGNRESVRTRLGVPPLSKSPEEAVIPIRSTKKIGKTGRDPRVLIFLIGSFCVETHPHPVFRLSSFVHHHQDKHQPTDQHQQAKLHRPRAVIRRPISG